MKWTIDALVEGGLCEQARVVIGDAPVTQAYAGQIGADGYTPDLAAVVEPARMLLGRAG